MKLSASHPSIVALAAACPAIPERMLEVVEAEGEPTLTGIHIGFTDDEVGSASIPLNQDGNDEFVLASYQFCEPPVSDVLAALAAARA